jgi:hypothetical protein
MTRTWRTSSFGGANNGNCVQVSLDEANTLVRDSKNVAGPVVGFSPDAWRALVRRARPAPRP